MFVRCGGIKDDSVKGYVSITGTHQDISETIRLEKEKEAERRLAEMNKELRQEKIRNEDYYRELLDMQSCGVMAYTLPNHKVIHMNKQALKMYGLKTIIEAQQQLCTVLRKVYYPEPETVERFTLILKNFLAKERDMRYFKRWWKIRESESAKNMSHTYLRHLPVKKILRKAEL